MFEVSEALSVRPQITSHDGKLSSHKGIVIATSLPPVDGQAIKPLMAAIMQQDFKGILEN